MTFLSLVAALILEQLRPLRAGNRAYFAFARYSSAIERKCNAGQYRDGVISWLLAIAPIALSTLVVYVLLRSASGVLGWIWNIAVLYVAFGFRHFSHFYNEIMLAMRSNDLTRAREVLAKWSGESAAQFNASEVARVAIELGLTRSHRHVFGVMAWFIVLGPFGAIMYRLAAMLDERWGSPRDDEKGAFGRFAAQAFEVIDWMPVRLTAIGFAVAGDFMGAVECWREQAHAWRSRSQGILLAAAAGALGVKLGAALHRGDAVEYRPDLGDGDEPDADYMQAAAGLIWRALVLWLFMIALATIASWF